MTPQHIARTALAALALSASAVHAQSSVTIFGFIDLAVTKGNGGSAANVGANGSSKAYEVKQSTSSRLGFMGREDLGGGLFAGFVIDHRFLPDTGAAGDASTFWNGKSIVQIGHKDLGTLWMGRDYISAFYLAVKTDPFGWDGVGQLGLQQFAAYRSTGGVRASDAIGYKSPNLSGLTVAVMTGLGEGTRSRDSGGTIEYTSGPLYVGLGYDGLKGGPATTDGNRMINAAFSYKIGGLTPMVYVAQTKTGAADVRNKQFNVGATYDVGVHRVKAAYGRFDPYGDHNTQQKVGLGYEYAFSKRTNVYVDGGFGKEEGRSDNRALAFGMRHKF